MVTIEEIEAAIQSGECKAIYYSLHTLWWTHLAEDVKAASIKGEEALSAAHAEILASEVISSEHKKNINALREAAKNVKHRIPKDPTGSPLLMFNNYVECMKWITAAKEKPEHFGKYQLEAFIKTHHQNSLRTFRTWNDVNEAIELERIARS